MNKRIWLSALMAGTLVGSALTVFAQDSQPSAGDNGPQAGEEGGHSGMGAGGPQGGMMMNPEKLKDRLGLTDVQIAQMRNLFKSQMEANQSLRDKMKIDMDTLKQKVDAKASDGDLKKVLDALSADRKTMEANRQKMEDKVRHILTPLQQAKMVLGMQARGGQMMEKWMQNHKGGKNKAGDNEGGDSGNAPGGN
jgi:Spy/CpxP family protein refolding chaperone